MRLANAADVADAANVANAADGANEANAVLRQAAAPPRRDAPVLPWPALFGTDSLALEPLADQKAEPHLSNVECRGATPLPPLASIMTLPRHAVRPLAPIYRK